MKRLAAAFCLIAFAALPAAAEPPPKPGGILEFAVQDEPPNYDCHANFSFAFLHPVAPHYSTLLRFDGAAYPQVEGDLADSWTVSADKLTYIFKLHPNVLFHDGAPLTSADVKASYERIVNPPEGVISARKVIYAAIGSIETPDPLTVIFRLKWPEAAMLEKFASPWNCIYRAAKLAEDPLFPKTNVLGTGPFVFVEHVKGTRWVGRRWEHYFRQGRPYLDGYQADFLSGQAVIDALAAGRIMAEFRSVTPGDRDRLVAALGSKISISEVPWLQSLLIEFNAKRPPFTDDRVRRALTLAIDRWQAAETLGGTTFLKFVGGLMRPGSPMATPEEELSAVPGFSRDIEASRAEARQLLATAGIHDLKITLTNRSIPMPYWPAADYIAEAWRQIGVSVTQERLNTKDWQTALETHAFEVAIDFDGGYFDDPTLQLVKYVSTDLSPNNFTNSTDRFLDALYVGQALTPDARQRAKITHAFEKQALTDAYTVPFLWWNRIVATSSALKGWYLTPSLYLEQDLGDVWLDR
jgi:peptide/nickel transport system substrate-binding protein